MNRFALLVAAVFGLNLFGKLLGFLRIQQIGAQIGMSEIADSLFLALIVISFWEAFILSGAVIPTLTSEYPRRAKEFGEFRAIEEAVNLLIAFLIGSVLIFLSLFFFGDSLASVIAPGMSDDTRASFAAIVRALSPTPVFATLTLLLAGLNRLHGGEVHFAISAILINAMSLPVLVWGGAYWPDLETLAVSYGRAISAATAVASLYQLFAMRSDLRRAVAASFFARFRPSGIISGTSNRTIAHYFPLILPLSIGVGAQEVNTIVDAGFASTVSAGGIASLGLADRLTKIVLAVLGGAIFVVCEPRWSKLLANTASLSPVEQISKDSVAIVSVVIPVYISIGFLAPELTGLAFDYGQMTDAYTAAIAGLVPWLAGAGFFAFLNVTLSRALIFDRRPGEVLKVNVAAVAVNFLLDMVLVDRYGLRGIVGATLAVTILQQFTLLVLGRKLRAVKSVAIGAWSLATVLTALFSTISIFAAMRYFVDVAPLYRILAGSLSAVLGALIGFAVAAAIRRASHKSSNGTQC